MIPKTNSTYKPYATWGDVKKEMIVHLPFWKEIITAIKEDYLASQLGLSTFPVESVVLLKSSEHSVHWSGLWE